MSANVSDGFPQFNEKFGELGPDGTYQVPARWQAGLSNVSALVRTQSVYMVDCEADLVHYRLQIVEKLSDCSSTVSSQRDLVTKTPCWHA